MEDKLQGINSQMGGAKEQLKTQMAELERLRGIERERIAEFGLVGKESGEEEDPRVGSLYDWYAGCQLSILTVFPDQIPCIGAYG